MGLYNGGSWKLTPYKLSLVEKNIVMKKEVEFFVLEKLVDLNF